MDEQFRPLCFMATFGLPAEEGPFGGGTVDQGRHSVCRQQIMKQYATHLADEDIAELARATEGMSGRDLRDIAEQTERRTASKVILPANGWSGLSLCRSNQKAGGIEIAGPCVSIPCLHLLPHRSLSSSMHEGSILFFSQCCSRCGICSAGSAVG